MERCVYLVTGARRLSDASPWASCSLAALTLGHSPEQQLLAALKLTRADMTVLLVHTVHCLWSGHVEGWHACTTEKKNTRTHELREGGGWGKKSQCPPLRLTTRSPPQWLRNLLHLIKYRHQSFAISTYAYCWVSEWMCGFRPERMHSQECPIVAFLCAFHTAIYVAV